MEERLQKYMARCGIASRRKCEELIARGLVEVNGRMVREPGVRIDPGCDRVKVEGRALSVEKPAYYIHYKVRGATTTVSDDLGRRTVMDCLPGIPERVYPVGRLDRESEGLLVLTNDGQLANYLTHPAFGVEKTYRVTAEGRLERDMLRSLAETGIRLGPAVVKPTRVELVRYDNDNTIVMISVAEGINREVRRIFAALGHEVRKLLRVQVGPLTLAGLRRGGVRELSPRELSVIREGMAGADPALAGELFPAGSAPLRKPKGPRGRPRPAVGARRGKPDPAKHRGSAAGKREKSPGAGSAAMGEKTALAKTSAVRPAAGARRGDYGKNPVRGGAPAARRVKQAGPAVSGRKPAPGRRGPPAKFAAHPLSKRLLRQSPKAAGKGRKGGADHA